MPGRSNKEEEVSFFKTYELFICLIALLMFLIVMLVLFRAPIVGSGLQTCGDGSFYDSCSIVKPYYCNDQGILSENASVCGCSDGEERSGDLCTSSLQTNPTNISLNYILDGQQKELNFTVYQGVSDQLSSLSRGIFYDTGEKPVRADFAFQMINDQTQREFLLPLVIEIQNLTKDKDEQAKIAISIVQNVPYGFSNKTTTLLGNQLNYSRYPYEVLSDYQGICGEKSNLLAFLLRDLGYGTVLFYNQQENHEAVGIECPVQYSYKGTGYCFVETTGPSIISDDTIQYVGGITLQSNPEIILISTGNSLGNNLSDYKDAQTIEKIRAGEFILFANSTFEKLKEKYGLVEDYYAG